MWQEGRKKKEGREEEKKKTREKRKEKPSAIPGKYFNDALSVITCQVT